MAVRQLENAIREHTSYRQTKGQIGLVPMDIYDCLEETLPHGLVIQLGELIMKLKGVGSYK
jgi:hypothetical protein